MMKEAVKGLASSTDGHISYLRDQSQRMKVYHSTPSESFGDKTNFTYLPRSSKIPGSLHELDRALYQKQVSEYVFVRDLLQLSGKPVIITFRSSTRAVEACSSVYLHGWVKHWKLSFHMGHSRAC